MNKKYIAIIYEGNKTERILFRNIESCFFKNRSEIIPISFPAGENIFMLYKQLKEDEFYTDTIELIREYNEEAKAKLEGLERSQFSEVYLFFDYDGHANNLGDELEKDKDAIIAEMLEYFDNETENGKLYINYPMVEALRDNKRQDFCFRRCQIPAKEVINYKRIVHELREFQDFRKYTFEDWKLLCRRSVAKANCIVNDKYEMVNHETFLQELTQKSVYDSQLRKYVEPANKIVVLSSVPLFILEYFKKEVWERLTEE